MKIMNINQRKMETKNFNELMDLVPSHVITEFNLTQNQTIVLGQLIMLNGLDYQKDNGYFYRSNKDLAEDCGVTTTGLLKILNKLINCKLIERKTGNRKDGASLYKINTNIFENNTNKIENMMKEQVTYQVTQKLPNELPIKIIDYLSDSLQVIDKLLNSYLTELPNEVTHQVTSDTESDIDKEIDIYNNLNKIINNIKETSNNINNKLNKIEERENIINNIQEKEDNNELDSTEFENEEEQDKLVHKMQALQVEDKEEKINEYQVEEEINVEPVTVEEEIDDTNTLTDEQLEARLINYFNEEKDTITNEHQLNEFETVFNMVLQNFKDNEQITNEQFNHARLFIVLPKLSELRYNLVQLNKLNKDTVEPSNEETLTTVQASEENASEPKEMPLNQKNTNTIAKEEGGEAITLDFEEALKEDSVTANSVHETPSDKADKLISYDDAQKTFIPRMHELYSQCNTKEDIQETYTTIIKGIEDFNSKGKFNSNTYNKLKSVAWESRAKYEIPIYRKAYEEKKAKEAAESVSSVAA